MTRFWLLGVGKGTLTWFSIELCDDIVVFKYFFIRVAAMENHYLLYSFLLYLVFCRGFFKLYFTKLDTKTFWLILYRVVNILIFFEVFPISWDEKLTYFPCFG